MSSNNKAKNSNSKHSINYPQYSKWLRLIRVVRDNVGNRTKTRQNKNINFGVAKKSENMLKKNRVPSPCRIKKCSIDIAISKKYSDPPRKNRKR